MRLQKKLGLIHVLFGRVAVHVLAAIDCRGQGVCCGLSVCGLGVFPHANVLQFISK